MFIHRFRSSRPRGTILGHYVLMVNTPKVDDLPPIFTTNNLVDGVSPYASHRVEVRRLGYKIYALNRAEISAEQKIHAFAQSVESSVIAGPSASVIYGLRTPPEQQETTDVYLYTLNNKRVRRRGIKQLRGKLSQSEITEDDSHCITTVERTFLDLGLMMSARQLVYVADGLLPAAQRRRVSLTTKDSLLEYLQHKKNHRGKEVCLQALDLAAEGVDSVKETELRLLLGEYGITELAVNPVIRDGCGRYVCEPDLADFARKISIQYEGVHHTGLRQMRLDEERRARTHIAGWVEVRIFAADLYNFEYFRGAMIPKAVMKVLGARSS